MIEERRDAEDGEAARVNSRLRSKILAVAVAALLGSGCQHQPAASIGVASMSADGTISLQLRAESPGGGVGDALLFYKPTDPKYAEVFRHIGGIKPGEVKPVPPWQ